MKSNEEKHMKWSKENYETNTLKVQMLKISLQFLIIFFLNKKLFTNKYIYWFHDFF